MSLRLDPIRSVRPAAAALSSQERRRPVGERPGLIGRLAPEGSTPDRLDCQSVRAAARGRRATAFPGSRPGRSESSRDDRTLASGSTRDQRPRELAPLSPHRAAVSAFSKGDTPLPHASKGRDRPHWISVTHASIHASAPDAYRRTIADCSMPKPKIRQ